jgi:hypothetical protein
VNLFEAVFTEAYDPKREPTERDKEFALHRAEVLRKYQGRKHKSGKPTKLVQQWASGSGKERETHERGRWKATERSPGRGQSVRAAARAEIGAPEKTKPGPREGLSKGRRGGIAGKTYREKQKPQTTAERGASQPSGPKKGGHWNEAPSRVELKAREEDPALAQAAAEKLKGAVKRMKQAGRANPPEMSEPRPEGKRRWTRGEKRSKALGGQGRQK